MSAQSGMFGLACEIERPEALHPYVMLSPKKTAVICCLFWSFE